jgi:hypothetical protein
MSWRLRGRVFLIQFGTKLQFIMIVGEKLLKGNNLGAVQLVQYFLGLGQRFHGKDPVVFLFQGDPIDIFKCIVGHDVLKSQRDYLFVRPVFGSFI